MLSLIYTQKRSHNPVKHLRWSYYRNLLTAETTFTFLGVYLYAKTNVLNVYVHVKNDSAFSSEEITKQKILQSDWWTAMPDLALPTESASFFHCFVFLFAKNQINLSSNSRRCKLSRDHESSTNVFSWKYLSLFLWPKIWVTRAFLYNLRVSLKTACIVI